MVGNDNFIDFKYNIFHLTIKNPNNNIMNWLSLFNLIEVIVKSKDNNIMYIIYNCNV